MEELLSRLEAIGAETEDTLERFMNDEEMYLGYVKGFPEEPTMKKLEQAVGDQDYETAEKEVHALKGIAINLGFVPMADSAIDMLEELRADNIPDALEAYEELEKQYKKYVEVIVDCR